MTTVLKVDNLSRRYATGGDVVHAIDGVSFEVRCGQFIALMGASGSGKSTLLHLLAGLDVPTEGRVVIDGRPIAQMTDRQRTLFRRSHIGFVFQSFNLLPTLTAAENVAIPLMIGGAGQRESREKALEFLASVGLEGRSTHRPAALSGGEQQRVAIARALVIDPSIILADEPTGNLDSRHGEEIWQLLRRLSTEEGRTIVVVTHEAAGAAYADRVIVMRDGTIMGEIPTGGDIDAAGIASRYQQLAG